MSIKHNRIIDVDVCIWTGSTLSEKDQHNACAKAITKGLISLYFGSILKGLKWQ